MAIQLSYPQAPAQHSHLLPQDNVIAFDKIDERKQAFFDSVIVKGEKHDGWLFIYNCEGITCNNDAGESYHDPVSDDTPYSSVVDHCYAVKTKIDRLKKKDSDESKVKEA